MLLKPLHILLIRLNLLALVFLLSVSSASAQFFELPANRKKITVPFRIVRNMVIVKTTIGGKGPYNFIIDSGVGIIVITDPSLIDSIGTNRRRTIKLSGLGDQEGFEAVVTSNLNFDINGIIGNGLSAAILKKDHFGLSNYAGMPIHGLIGYDFFNSLAVKFDFYDSTLTVARPGYLKEFKKGYKVPISVEQNKPYMMARIKLPGLPEAERKLVIDFGAGHSLLLENMVQNNSLPPKHIEANLGVGLTGPVNGLLGRVPEVDIGKYKFRNVITSFPLNSAAKGKFDVMRDGNLGLGILKKFTLILDYQNSNMYLKPGRNFKEPFEHDMSGLEYYADGDDLRTVIISRVEPGSAGDMIGLQKDDAIVMINFKYVADMNLEQIDEMFRSGDDKSLLLDVVRGKKRIRFILTLKRRI